MFIIAKKRKEPKYPSTDDLVNKSGVYMLWNTIQPLKGMKYCDMDEL